MSDRMRRILVPHYMQSFKCIGSKCEDSCCVGWRVDIDHDTYKKYKKVYDEDLDNLLNKKITRNRSNNHDESNYAKVKLDKNGACPFLNQERLCMIQKIKGEDYLSDVCTTYPRILNMVNGVLEKSATMSCPEALRLAVLSRKGIEFDEYEESYYDRYKVKAKMDTKAISLINKPQKYLWEFRVFTITVLQNRYYKLWERLIVLGMFYQKAQECVDLGRVHEIPNLIASYTNILNDGSIKDNLSAIPSQHTIQMELLKEIADIRFIQGIVNKRYLECYSEFLNGTQYTNDARVEDIGERYYSAYNNYYEPFMNEYEYVLENYLVNHVFKNIFPFTGEKSLFDAYVMLVLHYALIKLHLIGMAGFHKEMTVDIAAKLIQSFAKTVEHNSSYLKQVFDLLQKNNYTTMAYMAILIKN